MNKIVEPKYKHKKAAKLKRFLATWLSHVRGQAGEGIMTALYTMMILAVIFFIGIDVAGYTGTVWKLRNACNETLTLMKMENGFDSNTAYVFYNFLRNQGLDPSRAVSYTHLDVYKRQIQSSPSVVATTPSRNPAVNQRSLTLPPPSRSPRSPGRSGTPAAERPRCRGT